MSLITKKKLLLFPILFFSICTNSYSINQTTILSNKKNLPVKKIIDKNKLISPKVEYVNNDFKISLSGMFRIENEIYLRNYYLNKKVPDELSFFRTRLYLDLNSSYGEKKYGHKVIEAHSQLRLKRKWGVLTIYQRTTNTRIYLDDIYLKSHYHYSTPQPWLSKAWLKFSLNEALNIKGKKYQYLKLGRFSFKLGRGAALGPIYNEIYEHFSNYTYYDEFGSNGINLNGELIKNKLWYDLYYSKFVDNSSSVYDTFLNTEKLYHVGRRSTPYRGTAKDSDLWAARLTVKPINKSKTNYISLEPYIYANEGSDQYQRYFNDHRRLLGAYGIETRYKKNKLEFGAEVALNFGKEEYHKIDKNKHQIAVVKRDGEIPTSSANMLDSNSEERGAGLLYKGHSYVNINSTEDLNNDPAPVNDISTKYVYNDTYIEYPNSQKYPNGGVERDKLENQTGRIIPAHNITLAGWMGIIDADYQYKKNINIAAEVGYVSGDQDPTREYVDKKYKGFIGLHEWYKGKKISAYQVLGERYVPRFMGLIPGMYESAGYKASTNKHFSDLIYFGLGSKWYPKFVKKNKLRVRPNLIFFGKAHRSYKYMFYPDNLNNSHVSETEKARRFIGTEINTEFRYDPIEKFRIYLRISFFLPDGYYKDIKGVPYGTDYYRSRIPSDARDQANPADFRVSTDWSFYSYLALQYNF